MNGERKESVYVRVHGTLGNDKLRWINAIYHLETFPRGYEKKKGGEREHGTDKEK